VTLLTSQTLQPEHNSVLPLQYACTAACHPCIHPLQATGRKKLLLAGIVTDVCVLFPTLSALAEGYEVYVVVDASGTFNEAVRDAALGRAQQAGAVLINWFAVACELQKDWRLGPRAGAGLAELLAGYLPQYGNLITSHNAASAST
jgi:isochorismate hydrolase